MAVVVEEFNERRDAVFVRAVLHLERDSQKGIVIGKGMGKQRRGGRTRGERVRGDKDQWRHWTPPAIQLDSHRWSLGDAAGCLVVTVGLAGVGGAKIGEIRTATEEALSAQFGKTAKVSFTVTVTKEWRRDPKLVAAFLGGP